MDSLDENKQTNKSFRQVMDELLPPENIPHKGLSRNKFSKEHLSFGASYLGRIIKTNSPSKENIEEIVKGLNEEGIEISPTYFVEYREILAKEKITGDPSLANAILDDNLRAAMSMAESAPEDIKKEFLEEIREKARKYGIKE
jgi:hypothetical protein